MQKQC